MIDFSLIKDKSIALVMINTEVEHDAHAYLGNIIQKRGEYFFINEAQGWEVPLDDEQYSRLQETGEDKPSFLEADFVFPMWVTSIPEEDDVSNYVPTGMKLPDKS